MFACSGIGFSGSHRQVTGSYQSDRRVCRAKLQ